MERRAAEESAETLSRIYLPMIWHSVTEKERAVNGRVRCEISEEGELCVTVQYDYLCDAPLFPMIRIPIQQRFCFYPYLGCYEREADNPMEHVGDTVYVTKNGTVYHESVACTYLNVAIKPIMSVNIEKERNQDGRKYTECDLCRKEAETEMVYVTYYGQRYHRTPRCSAISRNLIEKKRSEVAGMKACSRCGKKKEEENK